MSKELAEDELKLQILKYKCLNCARKWEHYVTWRRKGLGWLAIGGRDPLPYLFKYVAVITVEDCWAPACGHCVSSALENGKTVTAGPPEKLYQRTLYTQPETTLKLKEKKTLHKPPPLNLGDL